MDKKTKYIFILVLALHFILFSAWKDKAFADRENDKIRPWWGKIESGFIYDNNIFQVRDGKESDLIWESMVSLAYRPEEIKWSARAIFDRYGNNSELNYSSYEVGGERPLGERSYGSLFFHISPSALLDKEDPAQAPFSLASYGFSASIDRDSDRFGNYGAALSYTRLDYGAPFDAKDSDIIGLSPSLFYRINNLWHIFAEYTYELGKARSGIIPANFPDDISYKAHAFSIKLSHRIWEKTRLRLRYRLRQKRFTARGADTFHSGRKDSYHLIYADVQYNPVEKIVVFGRIERLWRQSNNAFLAFYESRFTVSAAYRF